MRIKLITIAILFLVFLSCHNNNYKETEKVKSIKINPSKGQSISIEEFATELTFLKLETSQRSLFSNINKIVVNKLGIFILDKYDTRKVFHFSSNGKFINSIGMAGKGNGEYILPTDFLVNEKNQHVEIVDNFTRSNYFYDIDGNFIKRIHYKDYRITSFIHIPNSYYLIKLGDNKGLSFENSHFIITNDQMNKAKVEFCPVEYDCDLININPFSNSFKNKLFFTYGFDNMIYEFMDNTATPRYKVDFGEKELNHEDLNHGDKYVISRLMSQDRSGYINNLIYTGNELFFNFLYNKDNFLYVFNINSENSVLISKLRLNNEFQLQNRLLAIYDGYIIMKIDASQLCKQGHEGAPITQNKSYGFLTIDELKENVKPGDNPILILFKTEI
ncbi:6-bladed beta-propeller [Draconibacterium halophilum]|uniref:6-bladed beta-propeller n=1 Tax=Draconibacterium halophilum TaxID=2706887 RepID=A0A6C0R861_9BACT|nr:6-bladed beta-propeller [Draconibacterium halophilum]QIA06558.1 6-bladed beta-propeller [Draconibacterium halophilum]